MIDLLITFFKLFIPRFLFWSSIFFNMYIIYTFIKCIRKEEKLSDNLNKKDSFYFFLAITYLFTYLTK
jgi:hypothetical protein